MKRSLLMSSAGVSTNPDSVIKRVFDLTNQVRAEYHASRLILDKDLSFLAGEHACQMSTHSISFGHSGFRDRTSFNPTLLNISENIAVVNESTDPGQNIIMTWCAQPISFSRMIENFTHTGIGVAEAEDGSWYCVQIYATKKILYSFKESLLVVNHFINRMRSKQSLPGLSISFLITKALINLAKTEGLIKISRAYCDTIFPPGQDCDYIIETFPISKDNLLEFFNHVKQRPNYIRSIRKQYTDMGFYLQQNKCAVTCVLLMGSYPPFYESVPRIHYHFRVEYRCLQLVNSYREAHGVSLLQLSHQFCRAAERNSLRMKEHKISVDTLNLQSFMKKAMNEASFVSGVTIIPTSVDPLKELFLIWISNKKSKDNLLAEGVSFGFSMLSDEGCCNYATRIIGFKNSQDSIHDKTPKLKANQCPSFSDDEEFDNAINNPIFTPSMI